MRAEAKKKQAATEEAVPKKALAKKHALQQEDSSDDEKVDCPKQQDLSDQLVPLEKEISSAMVDPEAKSGAHQVR